MKRQVTSRVLRDRVLLVGFLGGILISIAGFIGYLGMPILTGEEPYLMNAAMSAGFDIPGYPLWYHGMVVVVPAFLVSLLGTLLIYRWGMTEKTSALKLIGTVIGVPLVAIVIAYLVTAIAFGIISVVSATENASIGKLVFSVFFGFIGMTGLALVFGLVAVAFAMAIVAPSVSIGAMSGYLLARGLLLLSRNHSSNG